MSTIPKNPNTTYDPGLFSDKRRSYAKYFRILLWLLIPFVLWWSLKDISLAELSSNLKRIDLEAVFILLLLNVFIFSLFSLRWWLILRAQGKRLSFKSLISYRLAGFGVTYFTPGPQFGGEPLQVILLNRREGIPTANAAASVAVDKLLELLANFSFLLVGVLVLVFGGFLTGTASAGVIIVPFFLLILPAVYLFALWNGRFPLSTLSHKLEVRFPTNIRIKSFRNSLQETEQLVSVFFQNHTIGLILAATLSVGIWIMMVLEFSLMLQFLGARLSLAQVVIALTAARIAFLLPLPAGLGTLEAGQVMAMGLIGVSPVIAISLTLLIRLRDVIFGGLGLWLGGIYSK